MFAFISTEIDIKIFNLDKTGSWRLELFLAGYFETRPVS